MKYDEQTHFIAATSDDRSVRVWRVLFKNKENHANLQTYIEQKSAWLSCCIEEIFCSFGHSARVWRCMFFKDQTLLTCGEDSMICHWSSKGSLLSSWFAHTASSIWSLACYETKVFSGASDGAVKQFDLFSKKENEIIIKFSTMKAKSMQKECQEECNGGSFPRAVCLVDPKRLVAIFDDGSVWICDYRDSKWIWKRVCSRSFLKGYVVLSISQDSLLLALGTLIGYVMILETGKNYTRIVLQANTKDMQF